MYHAPVVEAKTSAESSEAIIAKKVLWMTVLLFLFFRLYPSHTPQNLNSKAWIYRKTVKSCVHFN